jgi:hypothetical protein
MAKRRDSQWQLNSGAGSSTPKRPKGHQISDSELDGYSDDESMTDQFNDPGAFMRNFGGYASDEDDQEEEHSENEQGI